MNWHQQRILWLHDLDREIKAAESARLRYMEGKTASIESFGSARAAEVLGRVAWHNSDVAQALESEERWALDRARTYAAAVSALSDAYRRPSSTPA